MRKEFFVCGKRTAVNIISHSSIILLTYAYFQESIDHFEITTNLQVNKSKHVSSFRFWRFNFIWNRKEFDCFNTIKLHKWNKKFLSSLIKNSIWIFTNFIIILKMLFVRLNFTKKFNSEKFSMLWNNTTRFSFKWNFLLFS